MADLKEMKTKQEVIAEYDHLEEIWYHTTDETVQLILWTEIQRLRDVLWSWDDPKPVATPKKTWKFWKK